MQTILRPYFSEGIKILDVGYGDGFISMELRSHLKKTEISAVDIQLTDEKIQELENLSGGIRYLRRLHEEEKYDLILLLDVLEHLGDDQNFLATLVDKYASMSTKVMITVPAFQYLFSCHDTFLGHYRRYRLSGLEDVATTSGLKVISSGYLFLSLLLPKLVIFKYRNTCNVSDCVGNWNRGKALTALVEKILNYDNGLLIAANPFRD